MAASIELAKLEECLEFDDDEKEIEYEEIEEVDEEEEEEEEEVEEDEDLALEAAQKLNNAKLKGKRIRVSSSQAKNKLFIGNVPHSWAQVDFKRAVEEVGPGVLKVDLMIIK
ncbi:hypothetical protein ABZP36_009183, partial [Zizania latifolia]